MLMPLQTPAQRGPGAVRGSTRCFAGAKLGRGCACNCLVTWSGPVCCGGGSPGFTEGRLRRLGAKPCSQRSMVWHSAGKGSCWAMPLCQGATRAGSFLAAPARSWQGGDELPPSVQHPSWSPAARCAPPWALPPAAKVRCPGDLYQKCSVGPNYKDWWL